MKKGLIILLVTFSMVMTVSIQGFASSVPSLPSYDDVSLFSFEGEMEFDLNGMYYILGAGQPLNVRGLLDVMYNDEEIGTLRFMAQKSSPPVGSYIGDWAFVPNGDCMLCANWEFLTLTRIEDTVTFTLAGFDSIPGVFGELPMVSGSFEGGHFEGSPVPVPAPLLLLGSGIFGIIGLRRRASKA